MTKRIFIAPPAANLSLEEQKAWFMQAVRLLEQETGQTIQLVFGAESGVKPGARFLFSDHDALDLEVTLLGGASDSYAAMLFAKALYVGAEYDKTKASLSQQRANLRFTYIVDQKDVDYASVAYDPRKRCRPETASAHRQLNALEDYYAKHGAGRSVLASSIGKCFSPVFFEQAQTTPATPVNVLMQSFYGELMRWGTPAAVHSNAQRTPDTQGGQRVEEICLSSRPLRIDPSKPLQQSIDEMQALWQALLDNRRDPAGRQQQATELKHLMRNDAQQCMNDVLALADPGHRTLVSLSEHSTRHPTRLEASPFEPGIRNSAEHVFFCSGNMLQAMSCTQKQFRSTSGTEELALCDRTLIAGAEQLRLYDPIADSDGRAPQTEGNLGSIAYLIGRPLLDNQNRLIIVRGITPDELRDKQHVVYVVYSPETDSYVDQAVKVSDFARTVLDTNSVEAYLSALTQLRDEAYASRAMKPAKRMVFMWLIQYFDVVNAIARVKADFAPRLLTAATDFLRHSVGGLHILNDTDEASLVEAALRLKTLSAAGKSAEFPELSPEYQAQKDEYIKNLEEALAEIETDLTRELQAWVGIKRTHPEGFEGYWGAHVAADVVSEFIEQQLAKLRGMDAAIRAPDLTRAPTHRRQSTPLNAEVRSGAPTLAMGRSQSLAEAVGQACLPDEVLPVPLAPVASGGLLRTDTLPRTGTNKLFSGPSAPSAAEPAAPRTPAAATDRPLAITGSASTLHIRPTATPSRRGSVTAAPPLSPSEEAARNRRRADGTQMTNIMAGQPPSPEKQRPPARTAVESASPAQLLGRVQGAVGGLYHPPAAALPSRRALPADDGSDDEATMMPGAASRSRASLPPNRR